MINYDREATCKDLLDWLMAFEKDQLNQGIILHDLTNNRIHGLAMLGEATGDDPLMKKGTFVIGFNPQGEDDDLSRMARRN